MPQIRFIPGDLTIEVGEGENLLRAAIGADIEISSSCGGVGTCKKCKTKLITGEVNKGDVSGLSTEEIKDNYFLLCQALAIGDSQIEIPLESMRASLKAHTADNKILDQQLKSARSFEDRLPAVKLDPLVYEKPLTLKEATLEDPISDLERIKLELGEGKAVKVELQALKDLPHLLRENGWQVTAGIVDDNLNNHIAYFKAPAQRYLGLAIDIGTTTIVAELTDLSTGKAIKRASRYNAQITYGDDVISRIVFASKGDGLKRLQEAAVDTVNDIIEQFVEHERINKAEISLITAAGNTTMAHMLFGISPKYIREQPYVPVANYLPLINADEIGLRAPNAKLFVFPSMAGYVGGDIVSGLMAIDIVNKHKNILFIDVGTNGEMVLGSADWTLSCACSAGPAFEGGGVKDGMRATKGAIELVRVNRETLEPTILTIGGQKPLGICGSGLIDAIAELFLAGAITPNGKIDEAVVPRDFVRKSEGIMGYVLCHAEESGTDKDILITETDIDNILRAKGAIFAGMTTLLDSVGLSIGEIDEVLIAGAFGNYLDIEKAIVIGLLPDLSKEKFAFVGNGSLLGARLALLSKDMMQRADKIGSNLTYLDLSSTPKFMDMYMSALFLPHTDMSLFPTIAKLKAT